MLRTQAQNLGIALLAVVTALSLMLLLNPWLDLSRTPYLLFFGALTLSAWYGGKMAGIFGTLLSVFLANYFFVQSADWFDPAVTFRNLTFVVQGILISVLCGALKISQKQTRTSLQQLRASQRNMRRLINANIIGVVSGNRQGMITEANNEFLRMTEFTREDVLAGRVRWDAMTPFDLKPPEPLVLHDFLTSGPKAPYETSLIARDGHRIPVVVGSAPLDDQSDDLISFVLDLTQLRRAEQRLSIQFAVTRVLAEAETLNEAVPTILQALCESLGWQLGTIWRVVQEPPQLHWVASWHIPHLDVREFEVANSKNPFSIGSGLPGQVWETGQAMWITDLSTASNFPRANIATQAGLQTAMAFPILLENEVLGIIECFSTQSQTPNEDLLQLMTAIGSQIGQFIERKRAEDALRESQELFQQFMNHSPATAYIKDEDGCFIYGNELLAQSFGVGVSELMGRKDGDFFPAAVAQVWRDNDLHVLHTGETLKLVETAPMGDGDHFFMGFKFLLVRGNGQRFVAGMSVDITDHIRAEEALRESEQRFRMLADKVPVHIWLDDETQQTRFANVRYRDFVSPTANEPLPTWQQMVHPDDRDAYWRQYQEAVIEQTELRAVVRLQRHDGLYRWFEVLGLPRFEGDRFVGYVGCSIDITERKQAEEDLQRSERLYRAIGETINYGIWVCDPDGRNIYASQSFLNLVGITQEQCSAFGWGDVLHPDDAERTMAAWKACVETGGLWDIEHRFRGVDGQWHPILARGVPVRDEQGEIIYWAGINLDISGLKQVEAELRSSEERFRLAARAVAGIVYDWNVQTGGVFRSEGLYSLVGVHPDASQTDGWWARRMHPADFEQVQEIWPSLMDGSQDVYRLEYRVCHEDGRWVDVLDQGYIIRDDAGRMCRVVGSIANISDRKRAEAQREQLLMRERTVREEAERANRMKDEFLAVLSHELRSPLNPILGWTRLLRTRQFDAATTDRALETIERNAQLQTQLIEDLLDVSRILRGKLLLNVAPVSLAHIIEAAMETVQLAIEAKGIHVHTHLEPNVPPVLGDAGRLQQIVWNLLSNAVKFTPSGGEVTVELRASATSAEVQIYDTGRGIRPEFLPHVFDYFRQDDSTTTRQFGGLGLGLAIVRHLTELHGGTVQADSPGENQGATFTLRLPYTTREAPSPADAESPKAEVFLAGRQVLVVDDEADMRELATVILHEYGAQVRSVASAQAALQALDESLPDVLVSDVGMPGMDGYQLLRQVRSRSSDRGSQIPAIALTAYAGEYNQQQALNAGFQMHLAKPVEPKVLVMAIVKLLNRNVEQHK